MAFNGGRTQFNVNGFQSSGDYTFINLLKMAQSWGYNSPPTDPTAPPFPIAELDSDGYITSVVAGTSGVNTVFQMPTNSQYSGNWVLQWDGNGTLELGSFATSVVSGSLVSTTGSGSCTFVRTGNAGTPGIRVVATDPAPNNVRNIRLCKEAFVSRLAAGEQFNPENLLLVRTANPGAIRSLGWGGISHGTNDAQLAKWAQRMPRTYFCYTSVYRNSAIYGGRTSHSGSDYTLAYGGFALTDKAMVALVFDANAPQINQTSISINTTAGSPLRISWPSHGLAVGNAVCFGNSSAPPAPLVSATTYLVQSVIDANTFQVATVGAPATAINATSTATGVAFRVTSIPRININGTGLVPITPLQTPLPVDAKIGFSGPSTSNVSHLVYDATTGYFWLSSAGYISGGPPEVFVDYCAAIGAHPHLVAPFLAIEPVTDFMTSWASYATSTYSWMKPIIEPPNETWNPGGGFMGTPYAQSVAYALWGSQQNPHDAYGKWCSTLGQAMSTLYGNDRTKYSNICAVQTPAAHSGSPPDARLKSTLYVSQNGGQPAYKFVDRVCVANYYSPAERFTCQELIDAYAYSVTYAGNSAQQAILANAYAATCTSGNTPFTMDYVNQSFVNVVNWAKAMPAGSTVAGVVCYEGGWSPDYIGGNWSTNITAASNTNPCVLTLAATSQNSEFSGMSGNPAVVGMQITLSGFTGGFASFNGLTVNITAVNGSSITTSLDASAQASGFNGSALATYVNSATYSNTFRTAGANSDQCGIMNTLMNATYFALTSVGFVAEYPSNFLYTGNGTTAAGVWPVLQPDIFTTLTPQWNSIVAANSGHRTFTLTT